MNHESNHRDQRDDVIENEMEGHSYDGITECDNPMPGWWVWTFMLTVIFGFIYYLHYQVGGGPTLQDELKVAMAEIESLKVHQPVLDETEESLEQDVQKSEVVSMGASAYLGKCAACHGQALQGQIGPNLTDRYWIHGKGTRMDIVKMIRDGVPDKGMPAWGTMLSKDEVYGLMAFIISKKDSNPPNPKAPQGELVQ